MNEATDILTAEGVATNGVAVRSSAWLGDNEPQPRVGRRESPVRSGVGGVLRFAYADPPYIGQAKKHYSHDPRCAEVNHAELIERLNTYDGWALSLSSPSLKQILALCPDDVRVGAWVKPFCAFKVNVNPAYAWEPVIFRGGRKLGRDVDTVRDWCSEVITLKRGLSGVKPERVCHWLFDFLGMERGDVFDDIFPGSGAVTRAWDSYCASPRLSLGGGGAEQVGDDDGESDTGALSPSMNSATPTPHSTTPKTATT